MFFNNYLEILDSILQCLNNKSMHHEGFLSSHLNKYLYSGVHDLTPLLSLTLFPKSKVLSVIGLTVNTGNYPVLLQLSCILLSSNRFRICLTIILKNNTPNLIKFQ